MRSCTGSKLDTVRQAVVTWWDELTNRYRDGNFVVGPQEIITYLLIYSLFYVISPYEPNDDLLRLMTVYLHNYDFREMYLYSSIPDFNMYIGFTMMAGLVHKVLGSNGYIVIQIAGFILLALSLLYLLKDVEPNLRMAIVIVAVMIAGNRLVLGRPGGFLSEFMFLGMALSRDKRMNRWWLHLLLGAFMSWQYYLFPIYIIPLIAFHWVYLIPLLGGITLWQIWSGGEYLTVCKSVLLSGVGGGGRSLPVGELQSAIPVLLTIGLIFLIPFVWHFRKDWKMALTACYFLVPNQVRFLETAMPIIISFCRYIKFRPGFFIIIGLTAASPFFKPVFPPNTPNSSYFKGKIPHGSKVFDLNWDMYMRAQYNDTSLKVAPSFELEWLELPLRRVVAEVAKTGKLDCNALRGYQFDYVIETKLKEVPACLDLVDVSRTVRIWKIKPAYSAAKNPGREQ